MRKSKPLLWILAFDVFVSFLVVVSHSVHQVVADDVGNSEGISIDCGVTKASWDENNFYYEADDGNVVESGEIHNVSDERKLSSGNEQVWKQLNTLRSFPQGQRNCYSLQPKQGRNNNYLVRAYYLYGNYDNNNSVPNFEFQLGVNFWTRSDLDSVTEIRRMEVIHVSPTNNVDVCLVNTGHGIPFISLLELWPLENSIYRTHSKSLPLDLMTRSSLGTKTKYGSSLGTEKNYGSVRYADDTYGRSWFLDRVIDNSKPMSTPVAINGDMRDYRLPKEVLSTAIRPRNGSSSLVITLDYSINYEYYIYLHFFDFEERSDQHQQRKMKITFTDTIQGDITLDYQVPQTMFMTIPKGQYLNYMTITSTPDSGLPPMINALEIYRVLPQPNSTTREGDGKYYVYIILLPYHSQFTCF